MYDDVLVRVLVLAKHEVDRLDGLAIQTYSVSLPRDTTRKERKGSLSDATVDMCYYCLIHALTGAARRLSTD
jgi:hypothetical protein